MKNVNMLVTIPIADELTQQILAVSPQIKITNISNLVTAEQQGESSCEDEMDTVLAQAEVIYASKLPKNVITRAPKLKWIQVIAAGVEKILNDEMRQSSVTLTNASGIHATAISEIVLGLMLMFAKRAPLYFQLKQQKQWQKITPEILRPKTVGIVGLGHIGREVARLTKALGMRVIATRRSAKRARSARYVDVLLPPEQLLRLLSDSDFVVLSLPLTPETKGLIGEKELQVMKSSAYLINIARGNIVDEKALIHALEEKWIAGAGLDVFATEPLPTDSKLWELPNVIMYPHIAGERKDYDARATDIFCENLRRYLNGKRLINVVNKKKGY